MVKLDTSQKSHVVAPSGSASQPLETSARHCGRLTVSQIATLAIGYFGSFFANTTSQFVSSNLMDIQGGIGASADEASWLTTIYTMGSISGILISGPIIRAVGISRYVSGATLIFALAAVAGILFPALVPMASLRAVQGLVAGGLGPVAFIATFTVMGGRRLPLGLLFLASTLLLPGTVGPVVAAAIEERFGWQGLYWIQFHIGLTISGLALVLMPRTPIALSNLRSDWAAIFMLSACLSSLVLFLSQGTRLYWFESGTITTSALVGISTAVGFVAIAMLSPTPMISPRLMATRRFGLAIILNLVFRASFALTGYILPQFLGMMQGYRPGETASLMAAGIAAQVIAIPVIWIIVSRTDLRIGLALGLILCASGTALGLSSTVLTSADQLFWLVVLFSAGQVLFLASDLLIGALSLTAPDLPTASIAFNATTLGGTTLGVGLVANFVTEREKFHSNVLTESLTLYDSQVSDRLAGVAASLSNRLIDDTVATSEAVRLLAASARKQAWTLAFSDGYLLIAAVLAISAALVVIIPKTPSLRHRL